MLGSSASGTSSDDRASLFHNRKRPGFFWFVIDLLGITTVALFVLWRLLDDTSQVALVFGYVAHLALPVAFVWLPLAIVRGRRISIVLEGTCVVVFIWLFGSDIVRSDQESAQDGATVVTVLTYNLGNGLATPEKL